MSATTDPKKQTWTIEYEPGEMVGIVKAEPAATIQGRDHFIGVLDQELQGLRRDFIAQYDEL